MQSTEFFDKLIKVAHAKLLVIMPNIRSINLDISKEIQ